MALSAAWKCTRCGASGLAFWDATTSVARLLDFIALKHRAQSPQCEFLLKNCRLLASDRRDSIQPPTEPARAPSTGKRRARPTIRLPEAARLMARKGAAAGGRKGGKSRMEQLSLEERRELARKGARARWQGRGNTRSAEE